MTPSERLDAIPCLDENGVLDLLEGRLGDEQRARMTRHLDACERCRLLAAAAVRTAPPALEEIAPLREGAALLERGARVGRYAILEPIGVGGMAVVYAAHDPQLDRRVALKLLRPFPDGGSALAELRRRLSREAQTMARLSHPNAVAVYDAGDFEDQVYIAMELVEGRTLNQWLRESRRSWREVLGVFVDAGRGLAAAHAVGVVHRDFKPDNVLVAWDGSVQVTDFGLARTATLSEEAVGAAVASDAAPLVSLTGRLVGTPAYMAPEQYRGQPADARTEVFTFCVALFEALYGRRPFPGETLEELRTAVLDGRVQAQASAGVPPRVRRALLKGLRADPSERYSSMEALLSDLSRDTARRWRGAAIAAFFASALAAVAFIAGREDPAAACRQAGRNLAGLWDRSRKRTMAAAFLRAGGPDATLAWQKAERALDAYAGGWVRMYEEACTAARVQAVQSEQVFELRRRCLLRRLDDLGSVAGTLLEADAQIVALASAVVGSLPDLATCADVPTLRSRVGRDEMRIETIRVGRLEPGWTALASIAVEGAPHFVAYEATSGRASLFRIEADGRAVSRARAAWRPGWTEIVPLRGDELLAYNSTTGDLSVLRPDTLGGASMRCGERWIPGFSHLVPIGDELLAYRRATGAIAWGRIDAGRCPRLGGPGSWIPRWIQLMPFDLGGRPHLLVYDAGSGKAHIYRVEGREHLVRTHEAMWSTGWSAFVPFPAYGRPHYLAYKLSVGQVHIDRLSQDSSITFRAFQRPPGFSRVVPFRLKDRPHYLAYKPDSGETFVDRIDP
jgi:hypothetical protein